MTILIHILIPNNATVYTYQTQQEKGTTIMNINQQLDGTTLTVALEGRLDTNTAPEVESVFKSCLSGITHLILDMTHLDYLSSAGLRVILMAQKIMNKQGDLLVRNANATVMDVFEITGFIDILNIEKPSLYKHITLDETKMMGRGATGAVYQYQEDSIVKLYFSDSALEEIEREKKYAREAFILGIPTAISLGIVQVGEKYGLEYEFIKSRSMSGEIMANPDETEDLVDKLVDVAHSLHTTSHQIEARESIFTSAKELFLHHLSINPILSPEEKSLCSQFIESIPDRDTLIHGDFHPGNIMLSGGEALLIDIADICYGHPIFDLVTLHFTLVAVPQFSNYRDKNGQTHIGLTDAKSGEVWLYFIEKYFANVATSEEKSEILEQITALSILRMACLLTMHNRDFPEDDVKYFKESVRERLIPVLPDMIGKVTW